MDTSEIDRLAKIIWDYHHVNHTLKPASALFILSSHDLRVADYTVELFKKEYAPVIIISGSAPTKATGGLLGTDWGKPEAEVFADRIIELGVSADNLVIENKATNSEENVVFTKKLLEEKGIPVQSIIAVQKPYMERRAYATIKKHWPEIDCLVTSPPITYEEYPTPEINREDVINVMVGDLQRIKKYPALGYQIEQHIPEEVWTAYKKLVEAGYTKQLIENTWQRDQNS